jgi:hypothetical protein
MYRVKVFVGCDRYDLVIIDFDVLHSISNVLRLLHGDVQFKTLAYSVRNKRAALPKILFTPSILSLHESVDYALLEYGLIKIRIPFLNLTDGGIMQAFLLNLTAAAK